MPCTVHHTFKHALLYPSNRPSIPDTSSPISLGLSVYSLAYSPSDKFLAAGFGDGSVRIWRPAPLDRYATLNSRIPEPDEPKKPQLSPDLTRQELLTLEKKPTDSITALKFRPGAISSDDVLAIGDAAGGLTIWSSSSTPAATPSSTTSAGVVNGRILERIRPESFPGILSLDWMFTGERLAIAGVNREIRIFDLSGSAPVVAASLTPSTDAQGKDTGHANRISKICCHPSDVNILISAGWDGGVVLWDVRTPLPVAALGGLGLSGDSPVVWLPDGNHFGVYDHGSVKIFDVTNSLHHQSSSSEGPALREVGNINIASKALTATGSAIQISSLDAAPDGTLHFAGSVTGRAKQIGRASSLEYVVELAETQDKDSWAVAAARRSAQAAIGTADGLVQLINYS